MAVFASVGLPGLNGFVGEYLTLLGAFTSDHLSTRWFAVIGASGVILAAVYLLILFQRMFFGPITHSENRQVKDLSGLEIGLLVPIAFSASGSGSSLHVPEHHRNLLAGNCRRGGAAEGG